MTVDAIVEAAARILETGGHAQYSTNAVAEVAGVSIGSLYQYFPNKSAITRALIDREAALLLADAEKIAAGQDPVARLDHLLAVAVRHQLRRPVLAQVLDLEEDRLPPSDTFRAAGRQAMSMFRDCLAAICMASQDDLAIVTQDVLSMVRAIKESPGSHGAVNEDRLIARVRLAVHGYLGLFTGRMISDAYEINKSHMHDSTKTHSLSGASALPLPLARKGKPYPPELRQRVIAAVKGGLSRRQAAASSGVSYSAAIRWMKRLEDSGNVHAHRKGGRRPSKISDVHRAWLADRCRDRRFTLHGLVAELDQRGLKVDYRTVWTFVHASGLRYRNGRWSSETEIASTRRRL